jgi:hypothetical protein
VRALGRRLRHDGAPFSRGSSTASGDLQSMRVTSFICFQWGLQDLPQLVSRGRDSLSKILHEAFSKANHWN